MQKQKYSSNTYDLMDCTQCGVCCTETEMLLCEDDIKRLESKGFIEGDFVQYDKQGYATLKNRDGYCVFYDRKNHQCSVYIDRPTGCRVYPVILDEGKGIVLDSICESRRTISAKEKNSKGKQVVRLLRKIDLEALERCSK
ncbi:MAG: YkgJ family cysteine cluster protein [Candidatus Bathyarchaeota archaeon]|nr:YkgJ family cysteine cluster protein [Candidatus Bathyarchaeota archaeon]